jgi:hypothetical protein
VVLPLSKFLKSYLILLKLLPIGESKEIRT